MTAARAQTETSTRTTPNPADFVGVVSNVVSPEETVDMGTVVATTEGIVVI